MKNFKVTEKSGAVISYRGDDSFLIKISDFGHGLPERWVLHKDEPMAEAYDDADVLEEQTEQVDHSVSVSESGEETVLSRTKKMVKLKAEYTVEIEDITAKVAQDAINAEALAYLAATDWMIIREVDAGVACPAEIKAERAAARARIVK